LHGHAFLASLISEHHKKPPPLRKRASSSQTGIIPSKNRQFFIDGGE